MMGNIDRENLVILNDGSNTMIDRPNRRFSPLDLTFATSNIASSMEWQAKQDSMLSDQLLLTTKL